METATLILQILTLLVAAVGPFLAYKYARKLAVSSNRQAWIDALRDDVAHFIALKESRMMIMRDQARIDPGGMVTQRSTDELLRDKNIELQAARHRVRLRLRTGNAMHDRLAMAVEEFAKAGYEADRGPLRAEIVDAAEAVITHTWNKVERGE
ncbi:hypothetical protein EEB18_008910 [Sphingopyxis sp. OPL5]|uniref:hypothetical protein n=1 Tax=Sphingopyxis sp. OPL5 TaxID=2486273 RepID=UPI00164CF677|nr:hypothetical protein [Sphingopyxis sp. OPL5]QNO29032.1 hypothetical protein EEB18_008910 [Sphingopyxis sp. OPL5]